MKLPINASKTKTIYVIVKDNYWNKSVKRINFIVDEKPVIAQLFTDKYKWAAPLEVKLDASTTKITSSWDFIAFFHWDFWDWEKMENTRQWVISHTYKNPWKYTAKVTVETDNWFIDSVTKKIIVFKPINMASITFPENLWWQVWIWETLKILLTTSWVIKSVNWDFWDWTTFSCNWRECLQINHTYQKEWLYKITARISYLDWSPSTTANISINVIK